MEENIIENAKVLYNYLNVPTRIIPSDLIIGLGCMDKGIPECCVKLYNDGYGDLIIFSGNVGKGTEGILNITEAERFKNIAIANGVAEEKILLEKEATNTYENYKYTKRLLEDKNIDFQSAIIVQKPYVKRRCIAISDVEFSDKNICVTSQNLTFEEFVKQSKENKTMDINEIIHEIVGEISIIIEAPKFEIQSEQPINNRVLLAYNFLLKQGYTKHVISSEKIEMVKRKWEDLGLINKKI